MELTGPNGPRELWSFRDRGNRVIRDFERIGSSWTWKKDYIYRAETLSNTVGRDQNGVVQVHDVHVDHLGSPRYVTNSAGSLVVPSGSTTPNEGTRYFPFGMLVFAQIPTERTAFTGHERDDDGSTGADADIDYMHARYYNPGLGRFLSPDRAPSNPSVPQSWNRFAYAVNNPLKFTDPNGNASQYFVITTFSHSKGAAKENEYDRLFDRHFEAWKVRRRSHNLFWPLRSGVVVEVRPR